VSAVPAGRVVDAHLHLWDLQRSRYAWVTPALGPLHATFTPAQARRELEGSGVTAAVLVQAEDSERDTELMLEVAASEPWVAGVVGWIQLDDPARAEAQLDRWQGFPAIRGVRHLLHDDPREGLLQLPAVRASLRQVADRGLTFDVPDAWPRNLLATADLAAAIPDLPVVIDHLGKPPFGRSDWPAWRSALASAAGQPNVVAKVSGLEQPGRPLSAEEVRPAWDAALELFGPDRLMWGSDWPMTVRSGGYAPTRRVLEELVAELSPTERSAVREGTATRVYRLARASEEPGR
jgi:L-fuconolactonase